MSRQVHDRHQQPAVSVSASIYARVQTLAFVLVTLLALMAPRSTFALDVIVADDMFDMNENQLLSWIFGNVRNEDQAISLVTNLLDLKIDLVAQAVDLSDEQVDALRLAGGGDLHRFLSDYYVLRGTITLGKMPQDEWQEVWRKVQPLNQRFQAGLYGDSSLLLKTVRSILNDEQWEKYQELEATRQKRHYLSLVKATVASIEGKCPLTRDQRDQFIELLMEKSTSYEFNGQRYYQMYFVLYQMSKIPEKDLKPIFLDKEWKVIDRARKQGAQMAGALNLQDE